MNPDSLDEALDEARKGEEWGVVALFRAFNPGLVGYLRHHVRGDEEDVASEVWASAATDAPSCDPRRPRCNSGSPFPSEPSWKGYLAP